MSMWQQAEGRTRSACTRQSTTTTHAFRRPQVAKQRSKHDDKQVYYGIVNLRPDELVKLGTNLDKGEQELFHKIVRGRPPSKAGAQHARAHALCPRPHSSTRSTRARRRRLTRWVRTTSGTSARRGSARMTPRPACSSAPATHRPMRICPGVAPTRPSHAPHSPLARPSLAPPGCCEQA